MAKSLIIIVVLNFIAKKMSVMLIVLIIIENFQKIDKIKNVM